MLYVAIWFVSIRPVVMRVKEVFVVCTVRPYGFPIPYQLDD